MQILGEAEDLPKAADIKTQLISLWMAPVFGAVLLLVFVVFSGLVPQLTPSSSAEQVATSPSPAPTSSST